MEQPARRSQPVFEVEALTAEQRRVHVTVPKRVVEKFKAARSALSHSHRGAGYDVVLEVALDLVLERYAARNGLVKTPLKRCRPAAGERIPASVRRAVRKRANNCCEWPLEGGGVCGSTLRLEYDHVILRSRGGKPTLDNIRLLCRFHNELAARRELGDAWMDRFTSGKWTAGTSR